MVLYANPVEIGNTDRISYFWIKYSPQMAFWNRKKTKESTAKKTEPEEDIIVKPIGGERISQADWEGANMFGLANTVSGKFILEPQINSRFIDVIEYLAAWDSDFSNAVENNVSLANTEYYIEFQDGVSDEEAEEMVKHLS